MLKLSSSHQSIKQARAGPNKDQPRLALCYLLLNLINSKIRLDHVRYEQKVPNHKPKYQGGKHKPKQIKHLNNKYT